MQKMSTDPIRHALHGPTMGTRWSAVFHATRGFDVAPLRAALQTAVEEVDAQMSTWRADSDLMRLNAAPVDRWVPMPDHLVAVLRLGLEIGQQTGGAFDVGLGDAVTAWGFGPADAAPDAIRVAMDRRRTAAWDAVEIGASAVRKRAPLALDLNGIAKGYGVDRLAETLLRFGIANGLVGIDGELRALGLRPDRSPWSVAVETPDHGHRAAHSVLMLEDAAVATSGDYRHWIDLGTRRLSHTMDPTRGAPLSAPPASVTVVAKTCAEADAWATALMVLGVEKGIALAERHGLDALFLQRSPGGQIDSVATGRIFADLAMQNA